MGAYATYRTIRQGVPDAIQSSEVEPWVIALADIPNNPLAYTIHALLSMRPQAQLT